MNETDSKSVILPEIVRQDRRNHIRTELSPADVMIILRQRAAKADWGPFKVVRAAKADLPEPQSR